MFATIPAICLPVTFIIFSLILSQTQAFDIINALSVSVYGAVDESSKSDEVAEESTIGNCHEQGFASNLSETCDPNSEPDWNTEMVPKGEVFDIPASNITLFEDNSSSNTSSNIFAQK